MTLADLGAELTRTYATRQDRTMFVSGDGALRYGEIVRVIDVAKGAGVERIGIMTEGMRRR